jgi:hypothetical protein
MKSTRRISAISTNDQTNAKNHNHIYFKDFQTGSEKVSQHADVDFSSCLRKF